MDTAIQKWVEIADGDFEDGMVLLASKRYSGALLHFQQAVEKILKAHCFIRTGDIPPKSHDLINLVKCAKLDPEKIDLKRLKDLSLSYVRLRYPDLDQTYYSHKNTVLELIHFARDFFLWTKQQLPKN